MVAPPEVCRVLMIRRRDGRLSPRLSLLCPKPGLESPHRAPASVRDQVTYTDALAAALKATPEQAVAVDANCNHKKALYR